MRKYLLTQKIELPSPWPVALRQDLLIQCSSDFFSSVVAWRREEWSIRSSFASRLSVTASVLEDFDVHKRWRKQAWIGKGEFNGRILLQYSFFTLWGSSHCESPAFPHLKAISFGLTGIQAGFSSLDRFSHQRLRSWLLYSFANILLRQNAICICKREKLSWRYCLAGFPNVGFDCFWQSDMVTL